MPGRGGRPSSHGGAAAALLAPPTHTGVVAETLRLEHRGDRDAYDEQSPSTIFCDYPGGRRVAAATQDRALAGVLTREVLRRYGVELTPGGIRP